MTAPGPHRDDDQLLADLRAAVRRAGAPTPSMVAAAQAAFSWRTVDAELAALTHDSLADEAALVRGAVSTPRVLGFEGGQLSVELEHSEDALLGQLVPPTDGQVILLGADGELGREDVDELGCFTFARRVTGPVRLRCRTAAGDVLTDWVRL